MTLREISQQYRADALLFQQRIRQLEQQLAQDPQQAPQLRLRIAELRPLLRQSRELARLTEHYYDRKETVHAPHPQ